MFASVLWNGIVRVLISVFRCQRLPGVSQLVKWHMRAQSVTSLLAEIRVTPWIKPATSRAGVGKLRPRGHIWHDELFNPAHPLAC